MSSPNARPVGPTRLAESSKSMAAPPPRSRKLGPLEGAVQPGTDAFLRTAACPAAGGSLGCGSRVPLADHLVDLIGHDGSPSRRSRRPGPGRPGWHRWLTTGD